MMVLIVGVEEKHVSSPKSQWLWSSISTEQRLTCSRVHLASITCRAQVSRVLQKTASKGQDDHDLLAGAPTQAIGSFVAMRAGAAKPAIVGSSQQPNTHPY
ncbi:hypothetical protein VPH35_063473 [Triticum aestivum]|uniref:Uncharacterized protein n=1 Tax=Aegilops tauschii subsp. strangulata TaxID=200361 RepID=A0A453GQ68_AEGTS